MNIAGGHFSQLRDPNTDEIAFFVVGFRLKKCVEMVNTAGTHASHCIPVTIVGVHIMINQILFEVMRSIAPVLLQIKSKVSCDDLATSITHEARGVELSHEGIDYWHSSLSRLPLAEQLRIAAPIRKAIGANRSDALLIEYLILVGFTVVSEKVTPAQFEIEVSS